MTHRFIPGMARATALTRAGKLTEATAHIQRALGAARAPDAPNLSGTDPTAGDAIEGEFARMDAPPAPASVPTSAPTPAQTRATPGPRKSLGETLRHIAHGSMPAATVRKPGTIARDPRFTTHSHHGPHGSREYMLYLPIAATTATDPLPVILMLHGCTQSPQDFAAGTGMNTLAAAHGVIVIYPAQPAGANMNKCWNWFRPEDQRRGAGEPAILAAITREVLATHHADPARVYVAGLSAGGAAAVILAQAYPDTFAAAGVHSGLAAGSARDVGSAFAAMRNGAAGESVAHAIPTIVFHGTADKTVDVKNAGAVAQQAQSKLDGNLDGNRAVTRGTSAAGRGYERAVLTAPDGRTQGEVWLIDGAGHAWSGGSAAGTYTDPTGPDASAEMLRFFAQHRVG